MFFVQFFSSFSLFLEKEEKNGHNSPLSVVLWRNLNEIKEQEPIL